MFVCQGALNSVTGISVKQYVHSQCSLEWIEKLFFLMIVFQINKILWYFMEIHFLKEKKKKKKECFVSHS